MRNANGSLRVQVSSVIPLHAQKRDFAGRLKSSAFRVFLRLKLAGGRPALISSLHQEAVRALMAGDRLRAAKFYEASARVLVKLNAFEIAADRFREQGKMLREEATCLNSHCSPFAVLDLDFWSALKLFTRAAEAFEIAAANFRVEKTCRESNFSAGECYSFAAKVALAAKAAGYDDESRLLVLRARSLYSLAARAFQAAGNNNKAQEMSALQASECL